MNIYLKIEMKPLLEILRERTHIPAIGNHIPGRKNTFLPVIGHFIFLLFGWRAENNLPNIPKFIIILGPHMSNWDFVFGIATAFALRLKVSFMGKHTLFRKPFGGIMRWVGGIPIDRHSSYRMVDMMIDQFNSEDQFILAITPEGTRKHVDRWRTGFYHIASGADVPILMAGLDYKHRTVRFGPLIHPSGDIDGDMRQMQAVFNNLRGKNG